jgi:hypothetical protein
VAATPLIPPGRLHACTLKRAAFSLLPLIVVVLGTSLMRFRVDPRDVPPEAAARRLGKTLAEFNAALPGLTARGFPQADPTTGNFDLAAIDRWCDARHPHLFGGNSVIHARDARDVVPDRLARLRAERRG